MKSWLEMAREICDSYVSYARRQLEYVLEWLWKIPIARPTRRQPKPWNMERRLLLEPLELRALLSATILNDTVSTDWDDPSNWSAGVPTATSDATISPAGAPTVTLPDGATANSLTFTTNSTLGTGSGSLTAQSGGLTITANSGVAAIINSPIDGSGPVTTAGDGSVTFASTNTNTGNYNFSANTTTLNGASSLSAGAGIGIGGVATLPTGTPPPAPFMRYSTMLTTGDNPVEVSPSGVVYADGASTISGVNDLDLPASTGGPDANAVVPGIRDYNSALRASSGGLGNWTLSDQPYIASSGGAIDVVLSANKAFGFKSADGGYVGIYGVNNQESLTNSDGVFYFTIASGAAYAFNDFSTYTDARAGAWLGTWFPDGSSVQVTSLDSSHQNQIASISWYAGGSSQAYQVENIAYGPSDDNGGAANPDNIASLTLENWNGTTLVGTRSVVYSYYDGTTAYGSPGDLESANSLVYNSATSSWTSVGLDYYRYDYHRLLTASFSSQQAANALSGIGDPTGGLAALRAASDADIDPYAGNRFAYTGISVSAMVSSSYLDGIYYSYEYSFDVDASSLENDWWGQCTESRPDGSSLTIFTNIAGETLLNDLSDGAGGHWVSVNAYGITPGVNDYQTEFSATPSSIDMSAGNSTLGEEGYDSTVPDLDVTFLATAGEITRYVYASSTSDGNVKGYLESVTLYHGSSDTTGVPQAAYTYGTQSGYVTANSTSVPITVHPLASESDFPDGSTANTTSFAYTWYSGTVEEDEETTTLPVVTAAQNGPGTASQTKEVFASNGEEIWAESADGSFVFNSFDSVTGLLTETTADATSYTGSIAPPDTLPSSGINAITDINYNALREIILTLGPDFLDASGDLVRTADETLFDDANSEAFSATGFKVVTPASGSAYSSGESVLVNPIALTRTDWHGNETDEITMVDGDLPSAAGADATAGTVEVADASLTSLGASTLESLASDTSDYASWTHNDYAATAGTADNRNYAIGDLIDTKVYTAIQATTPVYTETDYGYNSVDVENYVKDDSGTITRMVIDPRGLTISTWVGTADYGATDTDPSGGRGDTAPTTSSANNMLPVESYVYDNGDDGGDGLVTESIAYISGTVGYVDSSDDRVTQDGYNWQDELVWSLVDDLATTNRYTFTYNTYDNLGDVIDTTRFYDTNDSLPSVTESPWDNSNYTVIGRSGTAYDNLGQVYQTIAYDHSGTVATVSNFWYNGDGDIIESLPGGSQEFEKDQYDGLDEQVATFDGYDPTQPTIGTSDAWTEANALSNDVILSQTSTTYDSAGDAIWNTESDRFYGTSTSTLGALTSSDARISYSAGWYDGIGRDVASTNYGVLSSPPSAYSSASSAPTSVDTSGATLVSFTSFNAQGEPWETTDSAGDLTQETFDALGRATQTIVNVGMADAVTTTDDYNVGMQQTSQTIENSSGDQTTTYDYGTTVNSTAPDLFTNDWLAKVVYSTTAGDDVQYTYDRQGETTTTTDQNGTTHTFARDGVGRELSDTITVASGNPWNIDTTVTSIDYGYKACGKLQTVSSESSTDDILNQIYYVYDTSGILSAEYQNHSGAVDFTTSEYVAYGNDASTTTSTVAGVSGVTTSEYGYRPTTLQYPTTSGVASTLVSDAYTGFDAQADTDDAINRLDSLDLGTATTTASSTNGALTTTASSTDSIIAGYAYLGIDTVIKQDYATPQIELDYASSTSGSYPGLDQFNRIVDQVFKEYGADPSTLDEYIYGRDAQGDVTYRENAALDAYIAANPSTTAQPLDQIYTNNDLGELTALDQGQVSVDDSGTPSIVSGTEDFSQGYTLDSLGNATTFTQSNDGTTMSIAQTRAVNTDNQITSITSTAGSTWATPAYDAAGNMTTIPQPGNETTGLTGVYDGWDRLVAMKNGTTVISTYQYDGQNRWIVTTQSGATTDRYYAGSQLLETIVRASTTPSDGDTYLTQQYIWSASDPNVVISRTDTTFTYASSTSSWTAGTPVTYYYLTDANDNVTALTDSSGNVVERYSYDAYGQVSIYNSTWTTTYSTSQVGNTIFFASMTLDPVTGEYYDNARWYNSSTATFDTTDEARVDPNTYRYTFDDPNTLTDPTGLGGLPGNPGTIITLTYPPSTDGEHPVGDGNGNLTGADGQRWVPSHRNHSDNDGSYTYYLFHPSAQEPALKYASYATWSVAALAGAAAGGIVAFGAWGVGGGTVATATGVAGGAVAAVESPEGQAIIQDGEALAGEAPGAIGQCTETVAERVENIIPAAEDAVPQVRAAAETAGNASTMANEAENAVSPLQSEAMDVADDLIAQRDILARNEDAYDQALGGGVAQEDMDNVLSIAGGLYNNVLARQQVLRGVLDNLLDSIIPPR